MINDVAKRTFQWYSLNGKTLRRWGMASFLKQLWRRSCKKNKTMNFPKRRKEDNWLTHGPSCKINIIFPPAMVQVDDIHFLKWITLMCTAHRLALALSKKTVFCSTPPKPQLFTTAIHARCAALGFHPARSRHVYSRLLPWPFLAPYGCRNGCPIEDATDNCHFEGGTGGGVALLCVGSIPAKSITVCVCVCRRQQPDSLLPGW